MARGRMLIVPTLMAVAASTTMAAPTARGLVDTQLAPASVAQLSIGQAALSRRELAGATDAFEAAAAADPRNKAAFVGLARVAEAQGLPGKAVRFYREALQIDPNDLTAIEGQGVAMARRGAIERARANFDRLKLLCAAPCAGADRLAAAIARGPDPVRTADATPRPAAAVGAVEAAPVVVPPRP